MDNPFADRKLWFLTGSIDLYGPEVLEQVAAQSREVARQLGETSHVPVEIEWRPVLTDRDAIRRAALDANTDDAVIGVIVWMHTFSPAKMWIQGLDALRTPLLHLHTQASGELPWDTIDMDFMNLNQSAHGDREFAYMATRLGTHRATVVGHASDPAVRQRVGRWTRAAVGWADLQRLRLVRFGDNMRNVGVTEGDKTEAELRLGVSVNTWGVSDLVDVIADVNREAVDTLVREYEDTYDVVPELRADGERHESLRYAARQEIALRRFLEDGGFGAFTTNFEDLGGLRQLPGLAVQRLTADGYGFGPEGDWKTAVLVRLAKVMGFGLPGGASIMEDYTYDLSPGTEKILGAHMLEVCPTLTDERPSLEIHPLGIGDREDPVRLRFTADPGPAVVVAMMDMRERFRLVANVVDVVEPERDLPNLPVACAIWTPRPDFRTSAECWLTAGGAHHTVMSTALSIDVFEDLADIAAIELAVIDGETRIRPFRDELRLNQVHYRLGQGF